MLHQLVKYASTHLETEPGFTQKTVRWVLNFSEDLRFLGVLEVGDTSQKKNPGQQFDKCPDLSQPELIGGKEDRCHFLIETAAVVALYEKEESDPEKAEEVAKARAKAQGKHLFFTSLLRQASDAMPLCAGLAERLDDSDIQCAIIADLQAHKAKPNDKVTLAVGEKILVDANVWHDWWRDFRRGLGGKANTAESTVTTLPGITTGKKRDSQQKLMRCFATGVPALPVLTHPKIGGLSDVGGLGTGDALICFDKEAFQSYGLQQSTNGAVSEKAAAAYRAALNTIIHEHSIRLAGAKVAYWFAREVPNEDDPLGWLEMPEIEQELTAQRRAKELLQAIRSGERIDLAKNIYYALTLSGASGRVMVRDWMEGQFETLVMNIDAWFDDLAIVHRDGTGLAHPPKFMAVLGATVRELKDLPPPFITRMWHIAISNAPIPTQAMALALARAKIDVIKDNPSNHARMGLLKAYHIRKEQGGQTMKPYLNEEHPHPAYHCGRLMAVLAKLQRSALGDVGAGVIQRFYAAASVTPALVLGRLTRTSQFHLNKLDGGLAYWYEQQIAGIWASMQDHVPATLTLEEQSLFALGYYQQLAKRSEKTNAINQEESK